MWISPEMMAAYGMTPTYNSSKDYSVTGKAYNRAVITQNRRIQEGERLEGNKWNNNDIKDPSLVRQ